MRTFFAIAGLAFAAVLSPPSLAQVGGAGGWSLTSTSPVTIQRGGETVAVYHHGGEEAKPFFYPLYGPTGANMTRHWPQTALREGEADDHIHHRGIWFGLGNVNGLDFWHFPGTKQDKVSGRIEHRAVKKIQANAERFAFTTTSDWIEDETGATVCRDIREFTLHHDAAGNLLLDATITLEASEGEVLICDDKEGFWSIRVPATMRLVGPVAGGEIRNSEGIEGRAAWGKRARWVQYRGPDESGKTAGIAILDHPSNLRHPTWWHARHYGLFTANPFGQGNFEKEASDDAGNYLIPAGESIRFRYRTIFSNETDHPVDMEAAFREFAASDE